MAKQTKKDEEVKSLPQDDKDKVLLDECIQHEIDSSSWLSTIRDTWDDKESMLLVKLEDNISKKQKSQVYNPVLSTAVIERSARVMAQPQEGKAYAVSRNDVGKNILMNMLVKHYVANADEEYSYLLKMRFLDLYSNVYGSFFGLVPWRINKLNGYIGPEILPINMRDNRPQPGKRSIDKSDWFGVRSVLSLDWLEKQDPGVWNMEAVEALKARMKESKSTGASGRTPIQENQSYGERVNYPTKKGDVVYPDIETFTEYRRDMWITWAPRDIDDKKSRPWILRKVVNPYPYGMLPIVVKHAFPLMDSLIGLGEFERGKTLQFALNSLVNLYLDGVKYSIFPPLHVNLNEVTPSSIKWGAGEKWYMDKPGQSVQLMNMHAADWLGTFQSTYGFLTAAISNLAGTTQVNTVEGTKMELGKTPQAIQAANFRETARDEWDRFMMEDCIKQVMERWMALITHKLDVPETMRVFGPEIKDLQTKFPNDSFLEVFQSGDRGNVRVDRSRLNDTKEPTRYDYEIVTGSTMKKSLEDEGQAASDMLKDLTAAPWILQEIRTKGRDLDIAELYKRRMVSGGIKDWDKILIEPAPGTTSAGVPAETGGQMGGVNGQSGAVPVTPGQPVAPAGQEMGGGQMGAGQFKDQEIAQAALQIFGGVSGVPPS